MSLRLPVGTARKAAAPMDAAALPFHGKRMQLTPPRAAASAAAGGGDEAEDEVKKAPAPEDPLGSLDLVHPPGFVARRLLVFAGILVAYTCLYLNRGTLTYSAPTMVADPLLGLTKTDIGAMTSAFPAAYGISKFAGGMLGAAFSPSVMLAYGLMATSVVNIMFGFGASVWYWSALWAINGALQGVGAPACAMLLTRWFAAKERGTYWGLWNISTNMGGFLSPIIVGYVANHYGWQWGMWAPGAFGLLMGAAVLFALKDSPEQLGFPPVEPVKASDRPVNPGGPATSKGQALKDSMKEVLTSWRTWLLAITYFMVYLVRQGCTSWLIFFLLETKGAVNAAAAALTVSGLELGGLVGGTLSGVLSDASIKAAKTGGAGQVGRRVQIAVGYLFITLGVLGVLRTVPAGSPSVQWLVIAALGFGIYGPQMLIGLCGAEIVSKKSVGASQGILGLISYAGAAFAGVPLAFMQQRFGWDGYFAVMAGGCVAAILLLLPLLNARSQAQILAEGKE